MALVGVVATLYAVVNSGSALSAGKQFLYTEISPEEHQFMLYLSKHGKSYGTKEEFEFRL